MILFTVPICSTEFVRIRPDSPGIRPESPRIRWANFYEIRVNQGEFGANQANFSLHRFLHFCRFFQGKNDFIKNLFFILFSWFFQSIFMVISLIRGEFRVNSERIRANSDQFRAIQGEFVLLKKIFNRFFLIVIFQFNKYS